MNQITPTYLTVWSKTKETPRSNDPIGRGQTFGPKELKRHLMWHLGGQILRNLGGPRLGKDSFFV